MKATNIVLLVLLAGLVLSSCGDIEDPTKYGPPGPTVSTVPLKHCEMKDLSQTISINGIASNSYPVFADHNYYTDSLYTITGSLNEVDGKKSMNLNLDVHFPESGVVVLANFPDPQVRGFRLKLDSMEINDQLHLHNSTVCPTDIATFSVAVLEGQPCDNLHWDRYDSIPATAELTLKVDGDLDGEDRAKVEGTVRIMASYRSRSGKMIQYVLEGEIELE